MKIKHESTYYYLQDHFRELKKIARQQKELRQELKEKREFLESLNPKPKEFIPKFIIRKTNN
mgnify:CR=1 FL=1